MKLSRSVVLSSELTLSAAEHFQKAAKIFGRVVFSALAPPNIATGSKSAVGARLGFILQINWRSAMMPCKRCFDRTFS
jgi:hypothetical protein